MVQAPKIVVRASKLIFHPGPGQSPRNVSISKTSLFTQRALCQTPVWVWATIKLSCSFHACPVLSTLHHSLCTLSRKRPRFMLAATKPKAFNLAHGSKGQRGPLGEVAWVLSVVSCELIAKHENWGSAVTWRGLSSGLLRCQKKPFPQQFVFL